MLYRFVDPLASSFPGYTPYHYVHNNPINLTDPTGMSADTTRVFNMSGAFLGQINDSKPNEEHFVDEGSAAHLALAATESGTLPTEVGASTVRSNSVAYIGSSTRLQMATFQAVSSSRSGGKEAAFALTYSSSNRQLSVESIRALNATTNSATIQNTAEHSVSGTLLGFGHTHTESGRLRLGVANDIATVNAPSVGPTTLADYQGVGRSRVSDSGHAQFIASPLGYTIYSSASTVRGGNPPHPISNVGYVAPYSGLGMRKLPN